MWSIVSTGICNLILCKPYFSLHVVTYYKLQSFEDAWSLYKEQWKDNIWCGKFASVSIAIVYVLYMVGCGVHFASPPFRNSGIFCWALCDFISAKERVSDQYNVQMFDDLIELTWFKKVWLPWIGKLDTLTLSQCT